MQPCWIWLYDLDCPPMSKPSVSRFCSTQGLVLWLLVLSGDLGDALALESCLVGGEFNQVCFRIQFVSACFFHPHLPCCSAFDGLEASSDMKSMQRVPGAKWLLSFHLSTCRDTQNSTSHLLSTMCQALCKVLAQLDPKYPY